MGTNLIVITFYSPSCLGQETAKGPFGLRVKLSPAHLATIHSEGFTLSQARRQDSVTGGAEINFGGAREVYLCEFERGTGAREIYPSLNQMNKVKTKN